MSMPVLFAILIGLLALVSMSLFLVFRVVGNRTKSTDESS